MRGWRAFAATACSTTSCSLRSPRRAPVGRAPARAQARSGDNEGLYREAHALKGSAGNLALVAVAAVASQLAAQIKSGAGAEHDVGELAQALADECAKMGALLDRLDA